MAKKPKTTVNVDAVKKDIQKVAKDLAKNAPPGQGPVELPAGSVQRESPLEQEMGSGRYREMIHSHNSKNKHVLERLPFTFPPKKKIRSHLDIVLECPECGRELLGSENTVGVVCSGCHKFVKPKNIEAESRGYNPDLNVGIFGTASDKLRLKKELEEKSQ
jgi:hypothetical protein